MQLDAAVQDRLFAVRLEDDDASIDRNPHVAASPANQNYNSCHPRSLRTMVHGLLRDSLGR
jgi:hypothetical protein